ncbi:MAG: LLM class oxidoreductase [Marinobacter sp.]|uniref:LLM class oxidoreductase n=1 Tax=Marinobacter sp. TaxID=50741 RepID=UPI00299F435C|nr:LLM class oxidoreductase [Marinobacter sp.]MDX1635844.1 LLM class oxidoreductase [Marinobacter sp.]
MSSEHRPLALVAPPTTPGFRRMFATGKLSLGLFFPIAAYRGEEPPLEDQAELARAADEGGFAALWTRDVPLRDREFNDLGQVLDPWVWMTYILPYVKQASLATGSLILPLRHPVHTAKAATSLDYLSGGRLVMGLASGDRPAEFPAFAVDHGHRGELFRDSFEYLQKLVSETYPMVDSPLGRLSGADLVPKAGHGRLPLGMTGGCQQSPDWLARHGDFSLTISRPPEQQARYMAQWRQSVAESGCSFEKPVAQSLYLDLAEDPDESPKPIHLGYRLGRNWLIELLGALEQIRVGHVAFMLRYSRRPVAEVVDELVRHVVPRFPCC